MNQKKGFVLYFDQCRQLRCLSDAQLGLLFRAVTACAEAEAAGEDGTAVLKDFPDMDPMVCLAFSFVASTLHRDAQTYLEKCQNYSRGARRRAATVAQQRTAQTTEMRKYVEELHNSWRQKKDGSLEPSSL